jgi:SH3-like domain-containing protein
MLVTLLSDQRTAIVRPGNPRPIHVKPDGNAHVRYLAQHGSVGRIDHCQASWCHIAIGKREGYIRTADVWGVGDNEVVD